MSASSAPAPARPEPPRGTLKELTLRGVLIGGLITLVFTAANVYLGLKVGLTFATSIPAAVISMAVLRRFSDHTIMENNIVQTIASAAGTLSAIIFVLPGLVIIGWWSGFPYWTTAAICAIGGVLGVMYSIPLRRALVTGSDLPYPEGVAAAEVLRVGDADNAEGGAENRKGLRAILVSSLSSAAFALVTNLKIFAGTLSGAFRVGGGATMVSTSLSLSLIGVGHLVGVSVGIAMLVGLVTSYGVLLPIFTAGGALDGAESLMDGVETVFATDVRFIGAGAIAVGAVWTLIKIIGPIVQGVAGSISSSRTRHTGGEVPLTERDIPFTTILVVILASMLPIGVLLWLFVQGTPLAENAWGLVLVAIVYILLIGLVVGAICGYMAGLIGASNSPVSGVGILVAITAALLIKAVHGSGSNSQLPSLVAYTLFTAAVVFSVATISNDNLQDLKTGQLVGATPWKQQVALIIGVVFGSLVIPPVLQLMKTGFGFAGAPGAGPDALAAPQASLISKIIEGIFGGSLDWGLIGMGALIGVGVIVLDELLGAFTKFRLPPLAVGMGMYLPISVTLIIPIGAFLGLFYDRWAAQRKNPEFAKRLGVLTATGLIVGESLFGVLFAGIVAATGKEAPLAVVGESFLKPSEWLGGLAFVAVVLGLYRWTQKKVEA